MNNKKSITLFDNESETKLYEHKITLDKIKKELLSFGLTSNQSKVFIYMGKYGSKTAPEISKALQLARTETYHIIYSLQNIGLVTAKLVHPTKYSAVSMKQAIENLIKHEQAKVNSLAGKKEHISEMWNELPFFVIETDESKTEKTQMLHGMNSITNKIKEMIENSTESVKIYGSIPDIMRFYFSDIFDCAEQFSTDLRIVISPLNKIPEFIYELDQKKIHVVASDSDNKCFVVNDKKEVLIFMRNTTHPTQEIFAWWSDSKTLVDIMTSLFNLSLDIGGHYMK